MKLRELEEKDLEKTRELRNKNKEWFFTSEYITTEQQQRWFLNKPKNHKFYVIEENGEIIGTIGLKEADEIEVFALTIDEPHRGKGHMKRAIQQLTSDDRRYYAQIMPKNLNSIRVFKKAGFIEKEISEEKVVLVKPTLTIFTPLAGRIHCWNPFVKFLTHQTLHHSYTQLILMDTGNNVEFSQRITKFLGKCDYPHCYIFNPLNTAGIVDAPRQAYRDVIHTKVGEIYNSIIPMVKTKFLWIIEDDIIPSHDAGEKLLKGFTSPDTFSVSAVYMQHPRHYPAPFSARLVAWKKLSPNTVWLEKIGKGIERIDGNGMGCVILKVFKDFDFSYEKATLGYDMQFYMREKQKGRIAKINWDVKCHHMENVPHTKLA